MCCHPLPFVTIFPVSRPVAPPLRWPPHVLLFKHRTRRWRQYLCSFPRRISLRQAAFRQRKERRQTKRARAMTKKGSEFGGNRSHHRVAGNKCDWYRGGNVGMTRCRSWGWGLERLRMRRGFHVSNHDLAPFTGLLIPQETSVLLASVDLNQAMLAAPLVLRTMYAPKPTVTVVHIPGGISLHPSIGGDWACLTPIPRARGWDFWLLFPLFGVATPKVDLRSWVLSPQIHNFSFESFNNQHIG